MYSGCRVRTYYLEVTVELFKLCGFLGQKCLHRNASTSPCNLDPRKPHFYIKEGFSRVYIISLLSAFLLDFNGVLFNFQSDVFKPINYQTLFKWQYKPVFHDLHWFSGVEMSRYRNPYEPRHDKTNKVTVRPAKIQISLGIRPVWSESSLCA